MAMRYIVILIQPLLHLILITLLIFLGLENMLMT
jgi:hypothetical protein